MNAFLNFIFVDLPEAFVVFIVGFSVFNMPLKQYWTRIISCSVLHAALTTLISQSPVPYQFKVLILLVWLNLLLCFVIKIHPGIAIIFSTGAFTFIILAEFFILMFYQAFNVNVQEILLHPLYQISAVWLYLVLLLGFAMLLRKYHFDLRNLLPKTKQNRYLIALIIVGSIELLFILALNTSALLDKYNPNMRQFYSAYFPFHHAIMLALFLVMIYLFRTYLTLTITRVETETETPYLQNIQDLVTAIRSIKHDAVNHYTAIEGFLKVGMYDLATDYVKQLQNEATDLVQVVDGVKSPAVSSLLHSKMAICVANHVAFTIDISTESQFPQVRSNDLIKVLGNMLDNAIRATLHEPDGNRYIKLEWGESEGVGEQYLTIENSGPTIPPDKLEQIFELGYTTKTTGEGGVGLAVVKSVIEKYNGKISISSHQGVTRFRITMKN